MSFNLELHYGDHVEQAMSELASSLAILWPESYDTDGEGLFAMLVRGTSIYVRAWVAANDGHSLASQVVDAHDMDDPSRADDPHATFITLLELTLDAIHDNIRCELDPSYGRSDGES